MNENVDRTEFVRNQFKAVEDGDFDALDACYAPNAVVWHNYDDREQSIPDILEMLSSIHKIVKSIEYQNQVITHIGNVYYVQHHFCAKLGDGKEIRTPVFMRVVLNDDGLIERLEEYIDSRALNLSTEVASKVLTAG